MTTRRRGPWPLDAERAFEWVAYALAVAAALAVLAVLWGGCSPKSELVPIVPADVPPGACQDAEDRLRELDCPEATTPAGTPFAEACERAAADGRNWCPVAISAITDCLNVERAAAGEWGCP